MAVKVALDDAFPDHPKVSGLSNAAFRLYVEGLCMCMRRLTDGQVPRSLLRGKAPAIKALVNAGLWEKTATGYVVHDWADYQTPAARILQLRASNAKRQRRHRENSYLDPDP